MIHSYFYNIDKAFKALLLISIYTLIYSTSLAELNPVATYYIGEVETKEVIPGRDIKIEITSCFLETVTLSEGLKMRIRVVSALQHFSKTGELIYVALGPYDTNFIQRNGLFAYAYLDRTDAALVKSAAVLTTAEKEIQNYSFRYWHAEAGHHDPVNCKNLIKVTTSEDLLEVEEAFMRFEDAEF